MLWWDVSLCSNRISHEAFETHIPFNFKRERLSPAWEAVIKTIKQQRECHKITVLSDRNYCG
jgi:hypothetical protein